MQGGAGRAYLHLAVVSPAAATASASPTVSAAHSAARSAACSAAAAATSCTSIYATRNPALPSASALPAASCPPSTATFALAATLRALAFSAPVLAAPVACVRAAAQHDRRAGPLASGVV